jgi:hypothetical protein
MVVSGDEFIGHLVETKGFRVPQQLNTSHSHIALVIRKRADRIMPMLVVQPQLNWFLNYRDVIRVCSG